MTVQNKYYVLVRGYALDSNLQKTSQDDEVFFYSSEAEVDAALAVNGTPGTVYTVRYHKEVIEE